MQEETGHAVTIDRFYGMHEHAWLGNPVCCHTHEINLVFSMRSQTLKCGVIPQRYEAHVAFAWVPMQELASIDVRPAVLKDRIFKQEPFCFLSTVL